jgi:hypothetical protein
MKILLKTPVIIFPILMLIFLSTENTDASKAGCEVYIYISNNSLFVCQLKIDDFDMGNLLPGKNKTFTHELLNDTPKKIKVKVIYDNPDYLESRSYFLLTKKLECGQSDSLYIAHTK